MNTPVKFELAKLLKEKGFDEALTFYFDLQDSNKLKPIPMSDEINKFHSNRNSLMLSAPTIADVIMWLYEKHGIWIEVNRVILGSDEWGYGYVISYLPKEFENAKRRCPHLETIESFKEGIGSYIGAWNSPTEAYETAILYTLNNLI